MMSSAAASKDGRLSPMREGDEEQYIDTLVVETCTANFEKKMCRIRGTSRFVPFLLPRRPKLQFWLRVGTTTTMQSLDTIKISKTACSARTRLASLT